jgi:hypothetical protein
METDVIEIWSPTPSRLYSASSSSKTCLLKKCCKYLSGRGQPKKFSDNIIGYATNRGTTDFAGGGGDRGRRGDALICQIDADLLEGIRFERLEPIDVEDADQLSWGTMFGRIGRLDSQKDVDFTH